MQIFGNRAPHRIKNEIYAFAPRQFGGWNEIRVPGHQDDLIYLFLVRDRSYIEAYPHVGSLLIHVVDEIRINEIRELNMLL